MAEFGQKVGQALVKNLPVPQKHPLRNFDTEKLRAVLADENFQMPSIKNMPPEQFGMHMSDILGNTIVNLQKALSDPNSSLSKAQKVDLASKLGSEGVSDRIFMLPGARSTSAGYVAGYYAPEGLNPGVIKDLVVAMGKSDIADRDALILSNMTHNSTLRHEMAHRGISKLQQKGLKIDFYDEELIMRLFDYALGDEHDKQQSIMYFDRKYNATPIQLFSNPDVKELLNKVQEEAFKELGGVPIPKPSRTLK